MNPSSESKVFLGMAAIVASSSLRQLLSVVEKVAQTSASVLVEGESGSGKELIARALHHYSLRCSKPWVDVSCAALPEHLVESELFGYEKGAFSGADSPKQGLFELAHGGTLFLDEIGELEPRMQVKLLRILDGAPYYRLGGTRKVLVDVRVVAATNQNLERMVEQGRFRGDLYYRLCQVTLQVPPLRERLDDIVPLALHFLKQLKPHGSFTPAAMDLLRQYAWPGNIRELRNTITKVAIMLPDDEVHGSDLVPEMRRRPPAGNETLVLEHGDSPNLVGLERHMIMKVLAQTKGHQQRAAVMLGISRRTLSRKLKTYEMDSTRRSCAS